MLGLSSKVGEVLYKVDFTHNSKQDDIGLNELPTDSFTQVDFGAEWTLHQLMGKSVSLIRNATDEEIRRHTSAIKDLVPESGRDIRLSLGFSF